MHLGRTGEAFFGDEALLRDEGDAAAAAPPAEPGADAEALVASATADGAAAVQPTDSGGSAAPAAGDAEAEELMFATELELEGGEAEPMSAARRSLLRRGALCSLFIILPLLCAPSRCCARALTRRAPAAGWGR